MPEYAFRDLTTGEELLIAQSMHDAVPIGDEVVMGGRRLLRLAQAGQPPIVSEGVRHIAHSLPDWIPGAHSYDSDGTPRIEGQRDVDAIERLNPQFSNNNMKR